MDNPGPIEDVEPVDHIWWVMEQILYSIEQTFQAHGIELPELRYTTFGSPIHDCEQVTVTMLQGYLGTPGDTAEGPQRCDGPRTGTFQAEIVRCVPKSNRDLRRGGSTAPNPGKMNAYTRSRGRDLWALLDSSSLLQDYNAVIADVMIPEASDSDHQAVQLNLTVQL